jgi:peptidoglycan/xylan/chitin deacetylase (PgdA/CDA1 family)
MLGIAAGAAAVFYAGWASMAPGSQLYGRTFVRAPRGSRQIALTFDDGPNDPHTLNLLDVLARYEVKATFFMIGRFVRERPDIARRVAEAGHVVGNHTYTHPNLIFCSPAQVGVQLDDCERVLADTVGEPSRLFRPPYGGRLPHVMQAARQRGLETIMWNVSSRDWTLKTTDAIEQQVASRIRGGDVVLMHDGGNQRIGSYRGRTVEAVERLIPQLKSRGFEFVTVPALMEN